MRAAQYQELRAEIAAIIQNAAEEAPGAMTGALTDVASREVRMMRGSIIRAVPEPKAVLGPGLVVGSVRSDHADGIEGRCAGLEGWGSNRIEKAHDELKKSVGLGEDMVQAARRIQTVMPATQVQRAQHRADWHPAARRRSRLMSSVLTQHRSLSKGVQWLATLDNRTCVVRARDGKWWSYEQEDGAEGLYSAKLTYQTIQVAGVSTSTC